MFKHMGVLAISLRTYFAQQKKFLFPVIFMHWEKHRAAFVEQVKDVQDAQCSADGLFDSMGHNSKYVVYTMYCNSISKLCTGTVQKTVNDNCFTIYIYILDRILDTNFDI